MLKIAKEIIKRAMSIPYNPKWTLVEQNQLHAAVMLAQLLIDNEEKKNLEWSVNTPLSRLLKTSCCPWCGNLKTKGHDPTCAFQIGVPFSVIKREIEENN